MNSQQLRLLWMGEYAHVLDSKKRLFLPVKFRGKSSTRYILTIGLENCLYLYTREMFLMLSQKLEDLSIGNKEDLRAVKRLFLAGASETQVDTMGRILVPDHLVSSAGLKKNCMILGVGNRIELWDTDRWKKYKKLAESAFKRLAPQFEI